MCDLSSVIVKMILVTYKFDVHPNPLYHRVNVGARRYHPGHAR